MATYCDEDDYAQSHDYANWTAYAAARANQPTLSHLTQALNKATRIINRIIGTRSNVTDSDYTSDLLDYCLIMTKRILGESTEGNRGNFIAYSPADYLNEKERAWLTEVAITLEKRVVMDVGI